MKTLSIVLLLCCSIATATEPPKYQPTFGLGDEPQQVCENGVCYYPAQITNNNFGLGGRIIARRAARPIVQPTRYVFGLPVETVQQSTVVPTVQYSAPVVVPAPPIVTSVVSTSSKTYAAPVASYVETTAPVYYQTASQVCGICGRTQTSMQVNYGAQPVLFREQVRQRRFARLRSWANRPGLFGWRQRAGLCQ